MEFIPTVLSYVMENYVTSPITAHRPKKEILFFPYFYCSGAWHDCLVYNVEGDPTTISEALSSPISDLWWGAINGKIDSLMANKMWKLVDLPHGSKIIGCKWV